VIGATVCGADGLDLAAVALFFNTRFCDIDVI
jgi:hypothetical protein